MNHPVIGSLHEQVGCYRRLVKLAELQHIHVQQGQTEGLLEVLAARQEVLEQVGTLEQTIGPAKQRWTAFLTELPDSDRAEAESLLGETRRLLEAITSADRNDVLVLQQRKLNLGRQITQTSSARKINRNYAAAAYGTRTSQMDVRQ